MLARLQRGLTDRYLIDRELGRGGMALVFLARDLKHDRNVAIKVVRPEFSAVLGGERFLREIRVTATLQHPHILPLYDSGEVEGLLFYVMPYVSGESLRSRLERERQLPVEEALSLLRTLASALDFAHRLGVIHRDIKPENILLHEGQPLLADFGIAVAVSSAADDRLTATGVAVGTPQYMSPEQAAGDRVLGPPSDIYSLGAVAYEVLVGEPPLTGPSVDAILARVLVEPPRPIRTVRGTVPAGVEAAVLKALAKLPADRFRTARDFAEALARPEVTRLVPRLRPLPHRIAIGVAAGLAVAIGVFLFARIATRAPPPSQSRQQLTFAGNTLMAAISPDGRVIAYVVQADTAQYVIVQDVAGGAPDTMSAVRGLGVSSLEWSPDGERLLWAGGGGGAIIARRLGGAQRRIGPASRAYWLPDGLRVSLMKEKRMVVVNLETGDSLSIPVAGPNTTMFEGSWSPDGRWFAVATQSDDPVRWSIRTVAFGGRTEVVAEDSVQLASPRWSSNGSAVYYARGTDAIWRVGVSPRTGRRRGVPKQLVTELQAVPGIIGLLRFSIAQDGRRMVYTRGVRFSNLWRVEAGLPRHAPRMDSLTSGTALRWSPVVSPDGRWIAFAQDAHGVAELFRMPIDGGPPSQITVGARVWPRSQIAWSPDGEHIAFQSVRAGRPQVYVAMVKGGELRTFDGTRMSIYTSHLAWAPGSEIAYQTVGPYKIHLLNPGSGNERSLAPDVEPGWFYFPHYSPEASRLAVLWWLPGNFQVRLYDLAHSSVSRIAEENLQLRGWALDGRYVYAQLPSLPTLFRIDTQRAHVPEPVLTLPFREIECTPGGPLHPNTFVCAGFSFVSDVWMIENLESTLRR